MNKFLSLGIAFSIPAIFSSCIDNHYDLSDIDKTSEIKINNLTIPVNLDPITLGDIFNIEEGDQIKTVTLNGKTFYAVEQSGSFHSDPVEIKPFTAVPGTLTPSSARLDIADLIPARKKAPGITLNYRLGSPVKKSFNYSATGIDKSIHGIDALETENITFSITLDLKNYTNFNSVVLNDVVLNVPKGLSIVSLSPGTSSYSASTGELKINSVPMKDGKVTISVTANGVDFTANDIRIDYLNHTLDFNSNLDLKQVTAVAEINIANPPTSINFDVDYSINKLVATSVTGDIEYSLEGEKLHIDPIKLNDIPDFLNDSRTDLILYNPQIFLNINNPVGDARLNYRSGLQIRANRNGQPANIMTLDAFEIGHSLGTGPYNFCLSPENPQDVPAEYESGLKHVSFPTLSNLLSGEGLPKSLDLQLLKPEIYLQKAVNFKLGRKLEGMEGTYRFLAPLALRGNGDSGSVIVYSEKKNGWFDEDLNDLIISHLEIDAVVTSTIPFEASLTGSPIDGNGDVITYVDADGNTVPVSIKGARIPGNATDHHVTIVMDGEIRNLDGISFEAVVRPDGSNQPLAPNQTLSLKQPRVKISGKYTTSF
ncbi:MAG: hypothetical protein K2N03_03140 [Muribaculaceae bacterium]|nr:hypothetical protein [Muribaculaceae bacterium]